MVTPEETPLTLEQLIEQCERAWNAFVKGDPRTSQALRQD